MTVETTLREAFDELASQSPAFRDSPEDILPLARQARNRRRLRIGAVTVPILAGLSVLGIVGASALAGSHPGAPVRATVSPAGGGGSASQSHPTAVGAVDRAVEQAVEAASPSGLTFAVHPLVRPVEGELGIDGSANDGQGAGRLYVVVDPRRHMLELQPCTDSDFVAGGSCTSTVLPDGNTLVLRGENGTKYTQVLAVVIHPDGTGVTAESDNGTFREHYGDKPITVTKAGVKRPMEHVTRPNPVYTVEQLGQVAVAADQAASECLASHCPS